MRTSAFDVCSSHVLCFLGLSFQGVLAGSNEVIPVPSLIHHIWRDFSHRSQFRNVFMKFLCGCRCPSETRFVQQSWRASYFIPRDWELILFDYSEWILPLGQAHYPQFNTMLSLPVNAFSFLTCLLHTETSGASPITMVVCLGICQTAWGSSLPQLSGISSNITSADLTQSVFSSPTPCEM